MILSLVTSEIKKQKIHCSLCICISTEKFVNTNKMYNRTVGLIDGDCSFSSELLQHKYLIKF